jgi:hypothetical protein
MAQRGLRPDMSRAEASALLGVTVDADSDEVRRAWRAWARLAHPDHGGDREFFDRLRQARDTLLATTDEPSAPPGSTVEEAPTQPPIRLPWSQVLRRPSGRELAVLTVLAGVAIALVSLVVAVGPTPTPLMLALAVGPGAVAAAGWAQVVMSRLLLSGADVAHRISALTVAWVPITVAHVCLAEVLGVSLVAVLPVLVLPFVVVVAAVNPGAGLWRTHPRRAFW